MKPNMYIFILLLFLIMPLNTYAGAPTETVKAHVDEVVNVLSSPADDNTKKSNLRSIAAKMFDFSAMSKATLGNNWKKFTREQQTEFKELLRKMLENAWMSKILGYTNEKTVFTKERTLSKTRVEVQSTLITKNAEVPMYYRMIIEDGQWKVYDIVIESISLIKNYRSQFREMLTKQSPEELLQDMRQKTENI